MWRNWLVGIKRVKPAPPSARQLRTVALCVVLMASLWFGVASLIKQQQDPITIVQNYYDNLDFRRYSSAYAQLDPVSRPSYEQYLLELSVVNGLVASYGKLDSVYVHIIKREPDRLVMRVDALWITALLRYPTTRQLIMVKRNGSWYIVPDSVDISIPPDQFFRRQQVAWRSQGRSRVSTGTTAFGDVLDRPVLQILSSRLVRVNNNYSVVGELINTDVNPADITVTAVLFDKDGNDLSTYNAQTGMIHKVFPKEVTPYRVDFEGVAGTGLIDAGTLAGEFKPGLLTPLHLKSPIASFDVYAKAVVTSIDLNRDVGIRNVGVSFESDGQAHLTGSLYNSGTGEATIPHMLITYYDAKNQVAWVDNYYIENAVEPERSEDFDVVITPQKQVETILSNGNAYTNILSNKHNLQAGQLPWLERYHLPSALGYSSLRVSINYLIGVV